MSLTARLTAELDQFRREGVYKRLNYLASPQGARVQMEGRGEVVILSSNNYLGLCAHPDVVAAGHAALDRFGAGTGSVRFICGTLTVHRDPNEPPAGDCRFAPASRLRASISCARFIHTITSS